ncbi:MAG TPA: diguanylate cyclase [Alphaproteobacteria bacterium]|nr:diguanylate cyclase [Alphaproteobacteria bacterium]
MSVSVKVLLVDADAERARRLAASIPESGYQWSMETQGAAALACLEREGAPDIVLLGERLADMSGFDCARALRRAGVATILLGEPAGEAGDLSAEVDDVVGDPFSEAELRQRLAAASRLKIMRDELRRRDATLAAYGCHVDQPELATVDGCNPRILLVGEEARECAEIAAMLDGGATVIAAANAETALDALANGEVEVAVLIAGRESTACLDLCATMRSNPQRFNLPIVVIAEATSCPDPAHVIGHGASDLLLRPVKARDLRMRLAALVRHERLRQKVAEGYRSAAALSARDKLTGLYTHAFLLDHLRRLVGEALPSGHTLSVAWFGVRGLTSINAKFGYAAGDALLARIGTVIGRLVRAEDLPARYDGASFCVILPGTSATAAETVVQRIASVVSLTEFALPDVHRPVRTALAGGVAELASGDNAESLVARARESGSAG